MTSEISTASRFDLRFALNGHDGVAILRSPLTDRLAEGAIDRARYHDLYFDAADMRLMAAGWRVRLRGRRADAFRQRLRR